MADIKERLPVHGTASISIKRKGEIEWKPHPMYYALEVFGIEILRSYKNILGVLKPKYITHNTIVSAGKDFVCAQVGSTSPGANGANYVALSNEGTAPVAGDTTLAGEIAANGLSRAIGAYAHSNGTTSFTISKTFTCITAAQACQKYGLFNLNAAGTMLSGALFTSASLQVGDSMQFTATITFA